VSDLTPDEVFRRAAFYEGKCVTTSGRKIACSATVVVEDLADGEDEAEAARAKLIDGMAELATQHSMTLILDTFESTRMTRELVEAILLDGEAK
jgi:hypothetical protein